MKPMAQRQSALAVNCDRSKPVRSRQHGNGCRYSEHWDSGGPTARLRGDDGPGKVTVNGGTINVFDALRLAKGMPAAGFADNSSRILLKGGTINAKAFESRSDNPTGLETITSTFTIDGGTFNQVSALGQATTIGQRGKVKLEILSGAANVMGLELGSTVDSQATVALSGGTLTINGNGTRV